MCDRGDQLAEALGFEAPTPCVLLKDDISSKAESPAPSP